jgi:hypothetical protein
MTEYEQLPNTTIEGLRSILEGLTLTMLAERSLGRDAYSEEGQVFKKKKGAERLWNGTSYLAVRPTNDHDSEEEVLRCSLPENGDLLDHVHCRVCGAHWKWTGDEWKCTSVQYESMRAGNFVFLGTSFLGQGHDKGKPSPV